ncbi:MAG: hypothetical protein KDB23_22400, partial [Planctomycetales bacterium]|nr:hypothetical protein [Planctomycetales bacterium]
MDDEKEIFLRAIEIESLDERQRFVDEVCGSNRKLQARICELLREYDAPNSCFSEPAARFDFANNGSES